MVEGGGVKNELKAVRDPSFEERRSVDETSDLEGEPGFDPNERNFLTASPSRMMCLPREKKGPHHEELQAR